MRKILTVISVLSLISFNANALERGDISATIGVAANSAVYGASAKETNRDDSSNIRRTASESGVFTESHTSGFIELNVGEFVSLGYEHTPDSITTPQADRTTNTNAKTTVSVDFNDLNIAYLKLNTPFGVYLKAGLVETDLDIKESMASGSTYSNVSTEGTIMGIGYNKALGERLAVRVEGSYMELDDVSTSNGVAADGSTVANSGRNQIDASNLEGLNGKIAITLTLGN
tara:strand:- start:13 stop:702 length:690 start_codon:yes stop_codon:yes gene_type:complete